MVTRLLRSNPKFLVVWCAVASFGAYFAMYAFRKPFLTGTYVGFSVLGLAYKDVLILAQLVGYTLSKFIGSQLLAGLRPSQRVLLVVGLILIAELALVFFAVLPPPFNWPMLFLNGLPLGMVWGVVFSFLEGRRITEFISTGLSLNLIIGSGFLKTIYAHIEGYFQVNEFLMPALMGLIFLPIFLLFVWMLSRIPKPSFLDTVQRMERKSLSKPERKQLLQRLGLGFWSIAFIYIFLTILRDFRDNYTIEIFREIMPNFNKNSFAYIELTVGIMVLAVLVSVGFFKSNTRAFRFINFLILLGLLLSTSFTWWFQHEMISGLAWMIGLGFSIFMPYLLIQTLFFERLIAILQLNANVIFFVYICDAFGYLGSTFFLILKLFGGGNLNPTQLLTSLSLWGPMVCFFLLLVSFLFFSQSHTSLHTKKS